mmetsp:Transcript_3158/g.19496  ORF Transcript_3158/g.19496 Transcript_3158/m.19496 type:complete len:99 (+) Transcript_3158:1950-2246(+)
MTVSVSTDRKIQISVRTVGAMNERQSVTCMPIEALMRAQALGHFRNELTSVWGTDLSQTSAGASFRPHLVVVFPFISSLWIFRKICRVTVVDVPWKLR